MTSVDATVYAGYSLKPVLRAMNEIEAHACIWAYTALESFRLFLRYKIIGI